MYACMFKICIIVNNSEEYLGSGCGSMANLFSRIKSMVSYKPSQKKAFVLKEDTGEGKQADAAGGNKAQDDSTAQSGSSNTDGSSRSGKAVEDTEPKKASSIKMPHALNDWIKNQKDHSSDSDTKNQIPIDINDNLSLIKKEFGLPENRDIIIREFNIACKIRAFIVYLDGMVDRIFICDFVLRQLMNTQSFTSYFENQEGAELSEYITNNVISANEIIKHKDINAIIMQILSGNTALFIDGSEYCLTISSIGYEKRSVGKPITENVIMGSQEGFTENLRTNLTLVRKIVKSKDLTTEIMPVGEANNGLCGIMYMKSIANTDVVDEVKRRVGDIKTAFVSGNGMVGQFIEDNAYVLLPQILTTERPDRVASFLVEGMVAVISEGTPFAEIVPITFYHLLQTPEEVSLRWQYGTFLRFVRILGIAITVFLPALYVGVIMFHQEMIPTELLMSIARSKEEVPFPTLAEILLLEMSFELIREGGIRVPGVIGQTLGIIGALILGQAAVAAKLVSPILIIIVAVTGLGSFAVPNYKLGLALRITRFAFIFFAAILGFYGIAVAFFLSTIFACSMKSFGVPYFSPVAPKSRASSDLIIRQPIFKQKSRPDFLNVKNRKSQSSDTRNWGTENKGGKN